MPDGMIDGPPMVENGPPGYSPRMDDVLPAGLEFRDEGKREFILAQLFCLLGSTLKISLLHKSSCIESFVKECDIF